MIRAVIVDDEAPARERLRRLLGDLPEVEIVGEAEDGEQAIDRLLETKADLVFLDIQMPGCSGLEVAASLPSPRPHLVFCTAFDQYAVDAFEINAVDYLLKPVNATRLRKALDRVRAGRPADDAINRAVRANPPRRFVAKHGNASWLYLSAAPVQRDHQSSLKTTVAPVSLTSSIESASSPGLGSASGEMPVIGTWRRS